MAGYLHKLLLPFSRQSRSCSCERRWGNLDDSSSVALLAASPTFDVEIDMAESQLPRSTNNSKHRPDNDDCTRESVEHHHSLRQPKLKRGRFGKDRKMSWIYFQRKSTGTRTASLRLLEYAWKKCVKGFSHNGRAADEDISTLFQKYGKLCSFVGRGSSGSIFLSHKTQEWRPELRNSYAVKVYCRKADLGGTAYRRRVESEFYILSLLKHRNIIRTFDLLSLGDGGLCAILEYCSDGDLCSLIILSGHLEDPEADCFFKQLMQGVDYLHEMGVAHRDLKPENLLLSPSGCLKISDFGNAECFRLAWESDIYMSKTRRGSRPYLSPEQYLSEEFDPRSVDVWAAAITYLAMRTGRLPWKVATDNDECFKDYVACYKAGKGNCHIEDLCQKTSRVIYSMLDLDWGRRFTTIEVLDSQWLQDVKSCNIC